MGASYASGSGYVPEGSAFWMFRAEWIRAWRNVQIKGGYVFVVAADVTMRRVSICLAHFSSPDGGQRLHAICKRAEVASDGLYVLDFSMGYSIWTRYFS